MKKIYIYNKLNVVMNFGLFTALFSFILLLLLIFIGIPKNAYFLFGTMYLVILIFILFSLLFIANLLKTIITIDDEGIEINSIFNNYKEKWDSIVEVKRKYIYSGGFPTGGPPRDLQFKTKDNKYINVLYFIINAENKNWDEDGLPEFEKTISNFVKFD